MAENMMDLIDGYSRLEKDTDDSIIYRPNKGVYVSATSPVATSPYNSYDGALKSYIKVRKLHYINWNHLIYVI